MMYVQYSMWIIIAFTHLLLSIHNYTQYVMSLYINFVSDF